MSEGRYDKWSFRDLQRELRDRGLKPAGDSRTRAVLLAALEQDDKDTARAAQQAKAEAEARASVKTEDELTDVEQLLRAKLPDPQVQLRVIRDETYNRNRIDEQFRVRNLPADYVYGWASMSAGNGEDIGNWTTLGWIRATSDMVSDDPSNTRKIYVSHYEDWNGYVRNRDCLLMIANRRIVDQRKRQRQEIWNSRVERFYGPRGAERPVRDIVSDPTEATGASMRRVAQWRAEDGLKGGE